MRGRLFLLFLILAGVCRAEVQPLRAADEQTAERLRREPGDLIVEGVQHQGTHWVARIPADAVQEVYVQKVEMVNLPPVKWLRYAGVDTEKVPVLVKQQIRFQLKPGKEAELFSDAGSVRLSDLIFSSEISSEEPFDALKAAKGEYALVHRVASAEEVYFEQVGRLRKTVAQTPLKLQDGQKQILLSGAIEKSVRAGYGERFNLYRNNWFTGVNDLLETVSARRWRLGGKDIVHSLPLPTGLSLRLRGLKPELGHIRVPTLAEEFSHFSTDSTMIERVRQDRDRLLDRKAEGTALPLRRYLCDFAYHSVGQIRGDQKKSQ
jgi:hypothetical protein